MKNLGIRINLFVCCLLLLGNSALFAAFTRTSRLVGPATRAARSVTRPPRLPLPGAQPARIRYPQTISAPSSSQPSFSGTSMPGRLPTSFPTERISALPTQSTVTPPVRIPTAAAPKREMPKLTSQQRLQNELAQKEAELAQAREAMRLRTEGTATQRFWQGLKNALAEGAYEQIKRLEAEVSRLKQDLSPFVKQQAEFQAAQRAEYLKKLPNQIEQELKTLIRLAKEQMQLEEILHENAPKSQLNTALQKVYTNFQLAFQSLYNRYKTNDPITKSMFVEVWKKIKGPDQKKILSEIAQGKRPATEVLKQETKEVVELPAKQVQSQIVPSSRYVVAPRPAQGLPRFIPRGPREQIQQQTFRELERAQVPKAARPAERARRYQDIARNMIEQAQTQAIPRSVMQQFARQQQPKLLPARAGQVVQPKPLLPQLSQVMPKKGLTGPTHRAIATVELPQSQLLQQTPEMVDVFSVGTPTDRLFVDAIMQGEQEPFMLVQSVPAQMQQPAQVSISTKNRQGLTDTLIINPAQVAPEIREFIKPLLQDEPIQMAFYSPKKSILQPEQSDKNPLQELFNALNDKQTVGVTLKSQPIAEPAKIETVVQRPMITLPEVAKQIPASQISAPMQTTGVSAIGVARPQKVMPTVPQKAERGVWQLPTPITEITPPVGVARPQKVMPTVPQRVQRGRFIVPVAAQQMAQQRGIATTPIISDIVQPAIKKPAALPEVIESKKPVVPSVPIIPKSEAPLPPKLSPPVEPIIKPQIKPVNPLIALLQQIRELLEQNQEVPIVIINQLSQELKGLARMLRAYNDQLRIVSKVISQTAQEVREQSLYTSSQTLDQIKNDILNVIDMLLQRA